jgi:hypothetical protein
VNHAIELFVWIALLVSSINGGDSYVEPTPQPVVTQPVITAAPAATVEPRRAEPVAESVPQSGGVVAAIRSVIPASLQEFFICIGRHESGLDNGVVGRAGEVSAFQIHPVHFGTFSRERLRSDPYYAAGAALSIYQGSGRGAWTTAGSC